MNPKIFLQLTYRYGIVVFLLFLCLTSCSENKKSVKTVMDDVVTRFYDSMNENELNSLSTDKIMPLLMKEELEILSTQHWMFEVNVPVIVSIMQDQDQRVEPFWLSEAKFTKTDMVVKNEFSTYNVWQKSFDFGRVNLGINGFDKHRPHYFISILPKNKNDNLTLSNIYPENQFISTMEVGAFTYHDWDELVLNEVPENLSGGKLLTTIRGRAREAHLIGAFRETQFPSSKHPDQIMLTWSKSPQTTQSIQWRTNSDLKDGFVRFWNDGSDPQKDYIEVKAEVKIMEDRLLQNDRYINRYTAIVENLKPGTVYNYIVGNPEENIWSDEAEFRTAPEAPSPFSFTYFGDTHKSPYWGELINDAYKRFPNTAFYTIGGDIVSTGLNRDEWDQLFEYSAPVIKNRPLMSTLGNHDSQDGLGVWMYRDLFDLPKNSPEKLLPETTYNFEYSNALFVMLDATSPKKDQTQWLEKQLSGTDAKWKFAFLHFPPYSYEEDYPEIRKEWGSLFDKYHVDIVFSGHVHYYMRSKPMFNQQPVSSPAEGTIYVISIAIPNRDKEMPKEEFVEVRFGGEIMYQTINIDDDKLVYRAFNSEGSERDKFIIQK